MLAKISLLIVAVLQAPAATQVVEEKYPDGAIKSRREVVLSRGGAVNHGESTTFYQNGQPSEKMRYVHGTPDGPAVEYHRNGKVKRERTLDSGRLHGVELT